MIKVSRNEHGMRVEMYGEGRDLLREMCTALANLAVQIVRSQSKDGSVTDEALQAFLTKAASMALTLTDAVLIDESASGDMVQ